MIAVEFLRYLICFETKKIPKYLMTIDVENLISMLSNGLKKDKLASG